MKEELQRYIRERVFITESGCWVWKLSLDEGGYGKAKYKSKTYKAHRLAYEAFKGKIPKGKVLCHTCDCRHCVNPEHLIASTQKRNMKEMVKRGRHTCKIGNAQPIMVKNIKYRSIKFASKELNINPNTIRKRLNDINRGGYIYI